MVLKELDALRANDIRWREGRHQGAVYYAGDEVMQLAQSAYLKFFVENPVMTSYFPSMARLESDLLSITADLLHLPAAHGSVTSGGSESNILAVIAARAHFWRTAGAASRPKIVLPYSAHPSFRKAAQYLGADVETVGLDSRLRADVKAVEAALDSRTMLLVASAPAYNTGVVDDIEALGAVATAWDLPLHVDACVGGFLLPFAQELDRETAPFDFRVPGVTSMSADIHKHGFAPKGVSIILFRDQGYADAVTFAFDEWTGGAYSTKTVVGSRSGGAVAAAWAVLRSLGRSGFREVTRQTLDLADRFREGIAAIPDLEVLGQTRLNKFGYRSKTLDIFAIADAMEDRGWVVMRQQDPDAIHMHVQIYHAASLEPYLHDLRESSEHVRVNHLVSRGKSASYNV